MAELWLCREGSRGARKGLEQSVSTRGDAIVRPLVSAMLFCVRACLIRKRKEIVVGLILTASREV